MKRLAETDWRVRAQVALWRHGSASAALLFALLLAAGLLTWALHHSQAALALASQARGEFQDQQAAKPTPLEFPDETTHLADLKAALHNTAAPDAVVRDMAARSLAAGIAWTQGDYRAQWHAPIQITQWQVTQPARASYPQLRRLIDGVLRAHPNVSLDEVALEREETSQSTVQVRLRWSIWTAGTTPTTAPEPTPTHGIR